LDKPSKDGQSARYAMSLFLLIFILLYGGLHSYMFFKAKSAFAFGMTTGIFLSLFMVIMVFAPILVRLLEKPGFEPVARILAYIGYTWMGILALFFLSSIVIDLFRFLVYVGGFISRRDFSSITHSSQLYFLMPMLLSICITIYGYFEARDIRTEKVTVETHKIPKEIGKLKIVQISDVHLGMLVGEKRLKGILEKVKNENPDILVSTGDLVDGEMYDLTQLVTLLKDINPRYGKFAITGNHEFYAGLDKALAFTKNAGFTILRGEGVTVAGLINIVGVDDPAGKYSGLYKEVSERELLSEFPQDKFTLFLKHRPLADQNAVGLFDLQLSGHAHKGQIFPFSLITRLYYPIDHGGMQLGNGSYLYVSKGAGTWGPPIRFLAPPDIVSIELIHSDRE
jgi:predicted MPP superfamily phosphohydrolase